nr:glycosyltransferase [Leucobacter luti]
MLILGIGQRTFLAGPAEISFPVETNSEASFAVVDGAEFAKVPGQANVVVSGDQAFVATGATRDVRGWVEPFLHAELSVDTKGKRLLSALIAPVQDAGPEGVSTETGLDPRGSDLWLEERTIDASGSGVETESLRVPVSVTSDQSVLIAADGTQPMPADVTLVWAQDRSTPWAGPLLVGGGVLALVGGLLYLLAVDHDRRGLGPRRGRRGPLQGLRNRRARGGSRRSAAASPAAAAGPAADPTPAAADGTESEAPPAAADTDAGAAPVSPVDTEAPAAPETPAEAPTAAPEAPTAAPDAAGGAKAERRAVTSRRPGWARRGALPALGLTVALGLSGCSASYWPQTAAPTKTSEAPSESPASAVAPVPVTDGQLQRIIEQISADAMTGDDTLDASALEDRFTGDALAQRAANYAIRSAKPDYGVVPPRITAEELDYELMQSTETWPRTLFVTVASTPGAAASDAGTDAEAGAETTGTSPSLALVMTQANPHENYRVSRVIALRGGISMPQAAPAEDGTAVLANDIETLVLQPGQVGAAYAALLQNGADAEEAQYFDLTTDSLLDTYGKVRAEAAQAQSDEKGQTMKFSVTARQGDEDPVALSTGAGGALVATTVIEEQIVDADGGRYKPQAKDEVTALSGLSGEQDRLVQEVAHQMLFFVPSKAEDAKIQLLGVTSELVGVRN